MARRDLNSLRVFHRNGIPIRRWRTAWRTACQAAGCPEPASSTIAGAAARTLIRASVPERVAMLFRVDQTSDATQRCLNPGFSERIGNSRRTGAC